MIILRQKIYSIGDILGNGQDQVLAYENGIPNQKKAQEIAGIQNENASKGKGRSHAGDRNGYTYQTKHRFINSSGEKGKGSFNATTYIEKGEKLSDAYRHHLRLLKDQGIELTKEEKGALKASIRKGEKARILKRATPWVVGGTLATAASIAGIHAYKKHKKDKKK